MSIHKDCYSTIGIVWAVGLILAGLLLFFLPVLVITIPLCILIFSVMLFILFFFRVPQRNVVEGENVVTSVADGKVVVIDKVYEPEYFKGECLQVSVYMNFFNVHANFWPISGEVTYYKYHPGKYMLAFLPKASELNEHSSVGIRSAYGDVFFKQLAGTFARRIVTDAVPGEKEVKGELCGIIKFGSRIDMYLPLNTDIKVSLNQKVKACETVIAELRK
ncbi:MAG: phosphatidylserine decarboxylase family protein [Bacteroidales bacterium]|nr:phosphatidylserine decarboxylase family protein [Bacteroidales bacterium]